MRTIALFAASATLVLAQGVDYTKYEYEIPARDGKKRKTRRRAIRF